MRGPRRRANSFSGHGGKSGKPEQKASRNNLRACIACFGQSVKSFAIDQYVMNSTYETDFIHDICFMYFEIEDQAVVSNATSNPCINDI